MTGGSSGIGLAIAQELVRRGPRVSLVARGQERLESAAAELEAAGAQVAVAAVDVADFAALESSFAELTERQGPCDMLVASAGLTYPGYFMHLGSERFRELMEVNYFGVLHAVRAVTPSMTERRSGSIVGISSTAGLIGVFGYSAYGPTKFAVRGLFETLRVELAPYGIHVGCVFPPDTETPQLSFEEPLKPAETRAISGSIRPIPAERVARATLEGIEKGKFWIMADVQTRLLARFGGLGRDLLSWDFDRRVRRVRSSSEEPSKR
ncbi:MAG: SDR family oxidoreductase [Acidimicrobiaceae bacterium]|nr:SDR family oxidoreductase [Acidimicrobiaceae bacterium]